MFCFHSSGHIQLQWLMLKTLSLHTEHPSKAHGNFGMFEAISESFRKEFCHSALRTPTAIAWRCDETKEVKDGSGDVLIDDDQEIETGFGTSGEDMNNDEKAVTVNEICR